MQFEHQFLFMQAPAEDEETEFDEDDAGYTDEESEEVDNLSSKLDDVDVIYFDCEPHCYAVSICREAVFRSIFIRIY
jgi:hypothetical protein